MHCVSCICLESEKLKLDDLILSLNLSRAMRRIKVLEHLSFILGIKEVSSLSKGELGRLREKLITQKSEILLKRFLQSKKGIVRSDVWKSKASK